MWGDIKAGNHIKTKTSHSVQTEEANKWTNCTQRAQVSIAAAMWHKSHVMSPLPVIRNLSALWRFQKSNETTITTKHNAYIKYLGLCRRWGNFLKSRNSELKDSTPNPCTEQKHKWLRKGNLILTGSVCAWTHQLSPPIDSEGNSRDRRERKRGIPDSLATPIDLESHTTSLFTPILY